MQSCRAPWQGVVFLEGARRPSPMCCCKMESSGGHFFFFFSRKVCFKFNFQCHLTSLLSGSYGVVQTEADVLVSALSLAAAVWHQLCHFLTFSCSFTADFGSGLTLVPLQHLLHLEIHPLFYYLFSLAWDSSLFLFLLFIYFSPKKQIVKATIKL